MKRVPTGSEIVSAMAGNRRWWQLRAGDIAPWVRTLDPSSMQELASRTEWIGEPWDGKSDVTLGHTHVPARKVTRILAELRRAIRQMKLADVSIPDLGDLRLCLLGSSARNTLVFDVDLGDFVLPVGIDDWALRSKERISCQALASTMAEHVRMADRKRQIILARETRLRRAVEETAAGVGAGVAPLWLRMDAVPFHEDPKHVASYPYVMLLVTLNNCLGWSPVGTERILSVKDVRDNRVWYARTQRPRAESLAAITASGSEGSISEIALAMINHHGLDPVAMFRQAKDARLRDRRGTVELAHDGKSETLYYSDGVLHGSIGFDGGHYTPGSLTLWGEWPEQLGIGARRRPLSAYVNHPAFVATGVTVTRGVVRAGAMDLDHRIRLIPIEAAGRADAAPRIASAG